MARLQIRLDADILTREPGLGVGDAAPAFRLADQDGSADADYTRRPEPDETLAALEAL